MKRLPGWPWAEYFRSRGTHPADEPIAADAGLAASAPESLVALGVDDPLELRSTIRVDGRCAVRARVHWSVEDLRGLVWPR